MAKATKPAEEAKGALQSPAKKGQSFEDFTAQEIAKYNVTDAKLAELKQQYSGIQVTDETSYAQAKEAKRVLVPLRTGVESVRKQLKSIALEYGRKVDGEAARITAAIEEIETPIDAGIKAWDKRLEEERQRVENQKIERAKLHIQSWVDLGALYNVQSEKYYYFDHENRPILNLTLLEIKELSEAEINFITENLQASFQIAQQRKAEEDRLKREEEDRLEQQRKDQEQRQRDQEAESLRIAQEKRELEDARYETRSAKLIAAGFFALENSGGALVFINASGKLSVSREDIISKTKQDWEATEADLLNKVLEINTAEAARIAQETAKEQERQRLENIWNIRKAVLITAGIEFDGKNYFVGEMQGKDQHTITELSEPGFNEFVNSIKTEVERLADEKRKRQQQQDEEERQRLAELAPDKEKIQALINQVRALEIPAVKSKAAKTIASAATELKGKMLLYLEEKFAGLK